MPNTESNQVQSPGQEPKILACDAVYCGGEYLPDKFWQDVEAFRQSGHNVLIEPTEDGYIATIT